MPPKDSVGRKVAQGSRPVISQDLAYRMRECLLEEEWRPASEVVDERFCPCCAAYEEDGHEAGCKWAGFLAEVRKAGKGE